MDVIRSIEWKGNSIKIINQKLLPTKLVYVNIKTTKELASAISDLTIRGAPAIGVAAAFGVALEANLSKEKSLKRFRLKMEKAISLLSNTRPTAFNLFWALKRMREIIESNKNKEVHHIKRLLIEEALKIHKEDEKICKKIGENGSRLIPQKANIMTHCNAGSLATSYWGTALGVIYTSVKKGKKIRVFATETRPLLQGARLTTWELLLNGVDVTLITDNEAGFIMKKEDIDCVVVGADRIATNGDVANKIGTYSLAILAKEHRIPFYVAAPTSTFDPSIKRGEEIPIEQRSRDEIVKIGTTRIAPDDVNVRNYAFDVTPARYISAIVTEKGVLKTPFKKKISSILGRR